MKGKIPMLNIDKIREDFPILQQPHHENVPLVFLDNGASSQKPIQVIEAMNTYYRTYHANVHRGIYKLSELATSAYENARKKVQAFIKAKSWREIIFTRGTTESINLVAQTWGRKNLGVGDVVVSTVMEHHANIVPWQILAQEKGFTIQYVTLRPDGSLDLDVLAQLLKDYPVKLVVVAHVSNVLGTENPIPDIIQMVHATGAKILVDGAQSTPHLPLDMQALDVDFYVFSGHKMLAPTGVGVLYGKRAILEDLPPWQGGGDMIAQVTLEGSTWNELPYKFEAGTPSIAEVIGLGYAIDYLEALGMQKIYSYEHELKDYVLERLQAIEGLTLYGHAEKRGAVFAFTLEEIHAHDVAQVLDYQGVAVRAGHHCAMPLHDYFGIKATTRASFYFYNTKQEVDALVNAIEYAKARWK
jgi:cysteine desulfurase / selenocysteine lyase